MILDIAGWIACAGVILHSGARLSLDGDRIALRYGLGRSWLGFILLASITSLPELMTGVGAVTLADAPDLAVGDVLGSCAFNLLILAVIDAFVKNDAMLSRAGPTNLTMAGAGIFLFSIVGFALHLGDRLPSLGWVGLSSALLAAGYLASAALIFLRDSGGAAPPELPEFDAKESARRLWGRFAVNSLAVVAAALVIPILGSRLARQTGLGETFVGSAVVAVSTSLPEIVVSVAAVRLGAVDLAVGNLLGSNLFNLAILAVDDALYTKGPILSGADPDHLITVLTAVGMTGVAVLGLSWPGRRKRFVLAIEGIVMAVLYAAGIAALLVFR